MVNANKRCLAEKQVSPRTCNYDRLMIQFSSKKNKNISLQLEILPCLSDMIMNITATKINAKARRNDCKRGNCKIIVLRIA
jgi:hypothetical protein